MDVQVPLSAWPKGLSREVATIDSVAIAEHLRTRLNFEKDRDDLDAFSAAIFVANGVPLALQLYDNIPTGNFTLIAMEDTVDDRETIEVFLNWSGLPGDAVKWCRYFAT